MSRSDILAPYRCVGRVFGTVPAAYQPVDKSGNLGFLTVPVNNCVLNYSIRPFRLVWSSDHFESEVLLLSRSKKKIFAALSDRIEVMHHTGSWVKTILKGKTAKFMLNMGDVLIVLDDTGKLLVVDWRGDQILVEFDATSGGFEPTFMIHPDTYFNKILLAGKDGRSRLININTAKLIHEFPNDGQFNCKITYVEQSPAKDVVAFGLANGFIHLRHLKTGKTLLSFKQDGAVTGLAFRSDGYETLTSSNADGTIALWDLKEQKLVGQKIRAHDNKINTMVYILGSPFLLTGGIDNKIVIWFSETEQSLPIPRKIVEGHSAPVTAFRFCGPNSLISAGLDGVVRKFNIHRTDLISRLGIAREVKPGEVSKDRFQDVRLEPITDLKLELMREHCFDNIACAHKDSILVSSWSSRRNTKGSHLFHHERFSKDARFFGAKVTSMDISNDGNLIIIGYSTGHVDCFSMQSGKFKFTLVDKSLRKEGEKKRENPRSHEGPVQSVHFQLNSVDMITIGADGKVKWWTIEQLKPKLTKLNKFPVEEVPQTAQLDRESQLLAIGMSNGTLRILDARLGQTARVFPKFLGENVNFNVLEFSPDSFYLLIGSSEAVIRVIHLQAALCLGAVRCSAPVVKAQFSEDGRFVTTCNEGQRELFVWTNRLLLTGFSGKKSANVEEIPIKNLKDFGAVRVSYEDQALFDLDSDDEENEAQENSDIVQTLVIDGDESDEEEEVEKMDVQMKQVVELLGSDLLSISGQPSHRWSTLPHIEKIKQRNTIKEVVKKPIDVPFFLESTPNEAEIVADAGDQRRFKAAQRSDVDLLTDWAQTLIQAANEAALRQVFSDLTQKATSIIDFEIRALPANLLPKFIDMILIKLEQKQDADFVQAILNTFLMAHNEKICDDAEKEQKDDDEDGEDGDVAVTASDLTSKLRKLLQKEAEETEPFENLYDETAAVLKWIRSAVL
ncbi:unnamed protein product [Bursaphelenchus xylophilus]|uniref:(pine wood nematode) hypothetical protein n=1 Tax=Bursaphelenchus xylophilus TaxID=6326 RepID=A0A1I7RUM4_BURXY|nr:unnamed protein product [Bursaphelenchus xylophilus]CAG9114224.1 unnamed protein product [Bursaphelenchus xylophilus]